jgi:hypothetical protein
MYAEYQDTVASVVPVSIDEPVKKYCELPGGASNQVPEIKRLRAATPLSVIN